MTGFTGHSATGWGTGGSV